MHAVAQRLLLSPTQLTLPVQPHPALLPLPLAPLR